MTSKEEIELLRIYKHNGMYCYEIGEDTNKYEVYGILDIFRRKLRGEAIRNIEEQE